MTQQSFLFRPSILSNSALPVLIPRPTFQSQPQILSNKPVQATPNLVRPRLIPVRQPVAAAPRAPLLTATKTSLTTPTIAPKPGSVIMKTFTIEGGMQVRRSPVKSNVAFSPSFDNQPDKSQWVESITSDKALDFCAKLDFQRHTKILGNLGWSSWSSFTLLLFILHFSPEISFSGPLSR